MNSARQKTLLMLSRSGMEFTWRYAWGFFLTLIILNRPLPFAQSLVVFIIAAGVTFFSNNRYQRVYQYLSLHFFGIAAAWILTIHRYFYRHLPFFDGTWLAQETLQLHIGMQWLIRLLLAACLLLVWVGARTIVRKPSTYLPVCLQFDRGLSALFLLLLIRFIVEVKGGPRLVGPVTFYLLFAFFTFSLIAISQSRNQSDVRKTFRPGYHNIGIVLGFASVVLAASAMIAVLFLPYLTLMADSAQSIIKETAEPMGPALTRFIRFIFSVGKYRQKMGGQIFSESSADQLYRDTEIGWAHGIGWFLLAIMGVLALGLLGYLIRWLLHRILNRPTRDISPQQSMGLIMKLIALLGAIFQLAWNGLLFLFRRIDSAAAVYAGLLRWGRRSGLPAVASETPREYGARLIQRFPQLQTEIQTIIEAFNREVYGQVQSNQRVVTRIRAARRRMRNPRHWPSRMRGWLGPQHNEFGMLTKT